MLQTAFAKSQLRSLTARAGSVRPALKPLERLKFLPFQTSEPFQPLRRERLQPVSRMETEILFAFGLRGIPSANVSSSSYDMPYDAVCSCLTMRLSSKINQVILFCAFCCLNNKWMLLPAFLLLAAPQTTELPLRHQPFLFICVLLLLHFVIFCHGVSFPLPH